MDTHITSDAIQALHERRSLTQRALAERPGVTDKAVSKWETSRGLPGISLVEPLERGPRGPMNEDERKRVSAPGSCATPPLAC